MTTWVDNAQARFRYQILENLEAGLELLGLEVRAIKTGKMSLRGAHVVVRGGEAYLVGASIAPYQPKNTPSDYDSTAARRLLVTKKEIMKLSAAEAAKGLTIIPISVYSKGRRLKISLAIARGKKQYDQREDLKRRDTLREIERTLKTK